MPWGRFWWKEWLADPKLGRLTPEQRGRFVDVWASTHGTDTPGVMDEDDVRAWAGYTPRQWESAREAFLPLFDLKKRKKKWVLMRVLEDYLASVEAAKVKYATAMAGVAARKRGKDLATGGSTHGATAGSPQVELEVQPPVQPGVNHPDVRSQIPENRLETTDKPDSEASARSQRARARDGSAGSAGSPPGAVLAGIVARATGNPTPSEGRTA
jgi:uncharacterized protein YdaU (DUF1376 family)